MSTWNRVDGWLQPAGRLLLSAQCVLCGAKGAHSRDLCLACAQALPWNVSHCARCARPLAAPALACAPCLQHPQPFAAARIPLRYEDASAMLLRRFKFHADLAAGRVLAEILAAAVAGGPRPDLVVPVPLHHRRLRGRGFDQAWELARLIARHQQLASKPDVLLRTRTTLAQTGLNATQRRRNMHGAFSVARALEGMTIALVDDVVTTGTTAATAAAALRRAGATTVWLWAVARVA